MPNPGNPSTHDDLIEINISFAPTTSGQATLTTILVLQDDVTPKGGRFAEYTSSADVAADVLATNLNSTSQRIADVMFGQTSEKPEKILFGQVDLTGSAETGPDGLDAVIAAGAQFYGVVYASRDPARQAALAVDIEAKTATDAYLLYGLQDDDADWLTTGLPAAWASIADFERTVVYYHDDNDPDALSDYLDAAHMANRLSWDPDQRSAKWNSRVQQVDQLTTIDSQAKKDFARENGANLALPFGTNAQPFVALAKTMAGRPVEHVVSADWLRIRIREAVADLIGDVGDTGGALTASEAGQAKLATTIEAVMERGITARHFEDYQLDLLPVTQDDIDNEQVRYDGFLQWASGIRRVRINLDFSAQPIAA